MPINYVQEVVDLARWRTLAELNPLQIPTTSKFSLETLSTREDADKKIITCTRRLSIFETIGAFFELLYLQTFSKNRQIRAILPQAWEALKTRDFVQQFVYLEPHWDLLPEDVIKEVTTYLDPEDLLNLPLVSKQFHSSQVTETGWRSVANRIECTIDPKLPTKRQVINFIENIKFEANLHHSDLFRPQDPCTVITAQKTQIFCKGIQTLSAYLALKSSARINEPIDRTMDSDDKEKIFESLSNFISAFAEWREKHENAIRQTLLLRANFEEIRYANFTSIPEALDICQNVRAASFKSNLLSSFTPLITYMPMLQYLNLSNNRITEVPQEIQNLTQLSILNISNNKLTTLPSEIALLQNLVRLYVTDNPLISYPHEIDQMPGLDLIGIPISLKISHWIESW